MLDIHHDDSAQRFEARVAGGTAECVYRLAGDLMNIVHTEVPPASEGHGVAAALVQAALDYAEGNGLSVMPLCSYVRAYIRRHPDTQALLAPSARL